MLALVSEKIDLAEAVCTPVPFSDLPSSCTVHLQHLATDGTSSSKSEIHTLFRVDVDSPMLCALMDKRLPTNMPPK